MDNMGSFSLKWLKGYDGGPVSYISDEVVCYQSGNNVKFLSALGNKSVQDSICPCPLDGLGVVAVHSYASLFAFSVKKRNPPIYIVKYPNNSTVATLEDGAKLEYINLAFSASDYLVTVSGVPDFVLTIWNYKTAVKLCSHEMTHAAPNCVTFNPGNWRQLCVTSEKEVALWTIEHRDDFYKINKFKIKLPPVDGSDERDAPPALTRSLTVTSTINLDLPQTSVARISALSVDKFAEYRDTKKRCAPLTHCWTPRGDVIVGCHYGQLFKVDGDLLTIQFLKMAEQPVDTIDVDSQSDYDKDGDRNLAVLPTAGARCLALHKGGLFAGGDDGVLLLMELKENIVRVSSTHELGTPITSLSFNHSFTSLAVGSSHGSLKTLDVETLALNHVIFDYHHGDFIAVVMVMPGNEYCATIRCTGPLQLWKMSSSDLVSILALPAQATCLASSPTSLTLAVGADNGFIYFVDCHKVAVLRLVQGVHVHDSAVRHLIFQSDGSFLMTAADDGPIFICDGRPSKQYKVLAFTDVPGCIVAMSCYHSDAEQLTRFVVTTNVVHKTSPVDERLAKRQQVAVAEKPSTPANEGDRQQPSGVKERAAKGANKLVHFVLPDSFLDSQSSFLASPRNDLKKEAVQWLVFNLPALTFGLCLTDLQTAYVLSSRTKRLQRLRLPMQASTKEFSKDSYVQPEREFAAHQLAGGHVIRAPDQSWLATCGADGRVTLRNFQDMDAKMETVAHDYHRGGVRTMALSYDQKWLLTTGFDGSLVCYSLTFSPSEHQSWPSDVFNLRVQSEQFQQLAQAENSALKCIPDWPPQQRPRVPSYAPGSVPSRSRSDSEADDSVRPSLMPPLTTSADSTWLQMKEKEAIRVEDRKYATLKKSLRNHINDMRERIQTLMRENEVVSDLEKLPRQEFDLDIDEQVRLRAEGDALVHKLREEKEMENLAKMCLREIIKKECWDDMDVKGRAILSFSGAVEIHNYPLKKRSEEELSALAKTQALRQIEVEELKARRDISEPLAKNNLVKEEFGDNDEGESYVIERPSINGSRGAEFGGANALFYNQFEMHTREQKRHQIIMLQDAIYRIKVEFNKSFDEVFQRKELEIAKISEKNKRIKKILSDLNLPIACFDPEMDSREKPELLLTVTDDEIKMEKYLTPEEKKVDEENRRQQEEKRLRDQADNWKERGLNKMMGGVLEVKREEELKKDIPMPSFMQSMKPEEEYTDEDRRMVQEYQQKVKELQEEREKFYKQLELELKKLQATVDEIILAFDDVIMKLFDRKVRTEVVLCEEELKILRLRYNILIEEELDQREEELNELIKHNQQLKQLSATAIDEAKRHLESFREQYETIQAEDKVLEKNFRREFNDCTSAQADQLYKLFKRRPRGQKARIADAVYYNPNSGNPFAERPPSSCQIEANQSLLEQFLQELDKPSNCPEGIDPRIWERLCNYRRQKIESEQLCKQKALAFAEMQAFLQRRQHNDEGLNVELKNLVDSLNKLKDSRSHFLLNMEVQLLLKQGQVEVDPGSFIADYTNCILVHRSVVEDVNKSIQELGDRKIASMVESKEFRKGIFQLEWEQKKMNMEMEDLNNKTRDITFTKITRQIQLYLTSKDYDAAIAQEIATLEQTMVKMKENQQKNVAEKKKSMKELKKGLYDKVENNTAIWNDLEELNVSVNERRNIHEAKGEKAGEADKEEKYRQIIQRHKLVELAKSQAQEVAILRAEVERLRMRTFPALVQFEH